MKTYVKIKGISCDSCRIKIKKALLKINNVSNVQVDGNLAIIEYNKTVDKIKIVETICNIGYTTSLKMISDEKIKGIKLIKFSCLFLIVITLIIISYIIESLFGFNIFNIIPTIDTKITYPMLFVIGLLTSFHCVVMCGAINLYASSSLKRNYKKPILYNLGRLCSYTLLGGIVGLIGGIISFNLYVKGVIILITSILMMLVSLNMTGIISLKFPTFLKKKRLPIQNSFIIGILNGFMPCGPLQAMQIYALSTGSFIYGALSMFLFCLGTIPLLLFIGILSNFLKNKSKDIFSKISVILILLLSILMMNRGLLQMGIDVSKLFKKNYDNYLVAEMIDGYQYIGFDLSYSGYKDIVVEKGKPVRIVIKADSNHITGCNNAIEIVGLGIRKNLVIGNNIIEFLPEKTGEFTYTCWMGMLKNNIYVVDDIEKEIKNR